MKIEIWSDVVCPFCYIGKRHFEAALKKFEKADEIEIEWKSFQLDPNFQFDPNTALDQTARLAQKYNRPYEEMKAMQQNIINTAANAGLDMKLFDSVQFNTFDAHCIIHKAKEKNLGNEAEEFFFKSHFTEVLDLNNQETLQSVALNIGLTKEDVQDALSNNRYALEVTQDIQEAQNLGITGVPFFVFDRKYGISGAQPVEAFSQTLEKSFEEWQKAASPKLDFLNNGNS